LATPESKGKNKSFNEAEAMSRVTSGDRSRRHRFGFVLLLSGIVAASLVIVSRPIISREDGLSVHERRGDSRG